MKNGIHFRKFHFLSHTRIYTLFLGELICCILIYCVLLRYNNGNMVPVPFIILYLKKVTSFLTGRNVVASRFLDMLFVAVSFPGTGAWTGAFIASVLDMPFWSALTSNFVGVILAGLLVNLLVNLRLKYVVVCGIILFVISTFMWSILHGLKKSFTSSDDTKNYLHPTETSSIVIIGIHFDEAAEKY